MRALASEPAITGLTTSCEQTLRSILEKTTRAVGGRFDSVGAKSAAWQWLNVHQHVAQPDARDWRINGRPTTEGACSDEDDRTPKFIGLMTSSVSRAAQAPALVDHDDWLGHLPSGWKLASTPHRWNVCLSRYSMHIFDLHCWPWPWKPFQQFLPRCMECRRSIAMRKLSVCRSNV